MLACLISKYTTTWVIGSFASGPERLLGGMWAVVATIFVFKDARGGDTAAALSRLWATSISFALCFVYLLLLPSNTWGLVTLIGAGTLVVLILGRREEVATTGITTTVVMVVAEMDPLHAWRQPILRLIDTIVGIGAALVCSWVGRASLRRMSDKRRGAPTDATDRATRPGGT
jgi:uncharacterized membrane protein YccC